jgi:hypothetical protein
MPWRSTMGAWGYVRPLGRSPNRIVFFLLTGGIMDNMWLGGRVNRSKKVVDDGNLTYFIIRYLIIKYARVPWFGSSVPMFCKKSPS